MEDMERTRKEAQKARDKEIKEKRRKALKESRSRTWSRVKEKKEDVTSSKQLMVGISALAGFFSVIFGLLFLFLLFSDLPLPAWVYVCFFISLTVTLLPWIVVAGMSVVESHAALNKNESFIKEVKKMNDMYLYNYLQIEVASARASAIGDQSRIKKLKDDLSAKIGQVSILIERMKSRVKDGEERQYLHEEILRAEVVRGRFEKALQTVEDFYGKAEAFFAECLALLDEMKKPLGDLALIQELNSLDKESQGAVDRVTVQIEETALEIMSRMASVREQVFLQFEGNGIDLAIEASNSGSFDEGMARLDEIIGQFIPAEEKLAKVISMSSKAIIDD